MLYESKLLLEEKVAGSTSKISRFCKLCCILFSLKRTCNICFRYSVFFSSLLFICSFHTGNQSGWLKDYFFERIETMKRLAWPSCWAFQCYCFLWSAHRITPWYITFRGYWKYPEGCLWKYCRSILESLDVGF